MTDAVKKKLKFSPKAIIGAKKQAFLINFCDRDEVKIECLKYLKHAVDLPIDQESQLTFLLNQFQARDIQASFYKLIGKVGGVAISAFSPMSSQKKTDQWIPTSDIRSQIYVDRYSRTIVSVRNNNIFYKQHLIQTLYRMFLIIVISPFILEYQYSNFNKTLSIADIIRLTREE